MRRLLCHLALTAACLAALPAAAEITVEGVRLWAGPDRTRVVLDLSSPVDHALFTLSGPDRVVVDLEDAHLAGSLPAGDGLARSFRTGARDGGGLRLVIDLTARAHPRSFLTEPNEQYGHRLVIDLEPVGRTAAAPVRTVASTGRDIVVAIDAGHGGEDPGASGARTQEKRITLALARALKRQIDAIPGMRGVLTREGDYFLSLEARRDRAMELDADLFISLHADAFRDHRARGAHVFVLSQRGASSEQARILAERENSADHIGGVQLSETDDVLATVLLDLAQTAALSSSLDVAEDVLAGLDTVTRLHKRTVQQAAFVVLKNHEMPSILVETGYITNPTEEARLSDSAFQQRMAAAIADGVRSYFWQNPPQGTLVASLRASGDLEQRYVVARGDTLSEIADRHRVTVSSLRAVNGIAGDTIRVGQQLVIPTGPR